MNWLPFIGFFLLFALFHSIFASRGLKKRLFKRFPAAQRVYRVTYNLISLVLLAIWLYIIPIENYLIYEIEMPWRLIFHALQLLALFLLFRTVQSFDTSSFLGLSQLKLSHSTRDFDLDESDKEALIVEGIYGKIRHPLYTFSMMFLVFNPIMSLKFALITLLCMLYFWIGSYFEEKRLIAKHGEDYRNYKKQTGRFFPKLNFIKG